jgi:predicted TIM-barrel fold metal-dependent hydrolase
MRIIDFHTHIFPDELAPAVVPALAKSGGIVERFDGTSAGLLAAMDRAGIDMAVVQPVATKPSQVSSINDWVASLASDRIVPFGAMHPDLPDPGAEIDRMGSLGIRGIKLHPEHQSFEPHEPRMKAIYAGAIEHGMIVFFHAGGDIIHGTVRGTPDSFERMLDAWPELVAVLAHMGGFREWGGVAERIIGRDVWLDTAYTPGRLPDEDFVRLVRAHGADRVLFGSDGPWADPAEELALLRGIGLAPDELAAILGGNAERLLSAVRPS